MDIFWRYKHFNRYILSVYALLVFKIFQSFLLPYTINNFLFSSLKLLTNFENAYWNPPQNSLLCDWSMFSSADLSLAAGKMHKNLLITGGFSMILQNHRRLPVKISNVKVAALGSLKDFQN